VKVAWILLAWVLGAFEATAEHVSSEVVSEASGVSGLRSWLATPESERVVEAPALKVRLRREEALEAIDLLYKERRTQMEVERKGELEGKSLEVGGKTLRWLEKTFGKEPAEGRSLWISMHGGGGAPQAVNDQQWLNQIRLYEPAEGIYIAPRAPTDTWNLWHEGHIDTLLHRLIENFVAIRRVHPDKVFLMGYSAGGDGVWQLAPRIPDRFAAAAMMAGHPNGARLDGLRNLPFAIFMGGNDAAYDRNKLAVEKAGELERLEKADPEGYIHRVRIYEGLGHWMNARDAEALPWMAKFRRNPWPKKIVWIQDDVLQDRFYWLKLPDKSSVRDGQQIVATVDGQNIRLMGDIPKGLTLLLSDELLDLDKAVHVTVNERLVCNGEIPRTAAAILQSIEERFDLPAAATARFVVP
jgi:pimeloyl-ACP methyl ester carboxylesterase